MAETIKGTTGNDSISNEKANVIIYGYEGNDTVDNKSNNVTIDAGAGNVAKAMISFIITKEHNGTQERTPLIR